MHDLFRNNVGLSKSIRLPVWRSLRRSDRLNLAVKAATLLFAGVAILTFAFRLVYCAFSYPPIYADEASFYSPALNLAISGTLATTVHEHFLPFAASSTYWVPPLYPVTLASWMRVAGTTIGSAKGLSTMLVLAAGLAVTSLTIGWQRKIIVGALFLCCPFVLLSAAIIRMESLALLIGMLSYLAVVRVAPATVCGFLSGLAFMTHPMAWPLSVMLFIATSARGRREAVMFILISTLTTVPYLFYISLNPDAYVAQMSLQLLRKAGKTWASLQGSYVLQSAALATIAIVLVFYSTLNRSSKASLYAGVLITFYLALRSNEFNYHVYLVPFVIGGIAVLPGQPWLNGKREMAMLLAMFLGFAAVNYAKWRGYGFAIDEAYLSLVREVTRAVDFSTGRTFVSGHPDFSIFLLEAGNDVERMNGVAGRGEAGWSRDFDRWVAVDRGSEAYDVRFVDEKEQDEWRVEHRFLSGAGECVIHVLRRIDSGQED